MEKDFILNEISENKKILFENINFRENYIQIHHNKNLPRDYPRMSFVLMSLSRLCKHNLLSQEEKEKLLNLFSEIFSFSKINLKKEDLRYLELYGMRFLHNLNSDISICLESFKEENYKNIYAYPVATYVFLSCYFEVKEFKEKYAFVESIKNTCLQTFDYLLYSNNEDKYYSFHFSEISAWRENTENHLYEKAISKIEKMFLRDLENNNASSGIAKSLEHFARIGDMNNFQRGILFLKNRDMDRFSEHLNPNYKNKKRIFAEYNFSQYFCLDTNAHLLNAYLNLLENKHYES